MESSETSSPGACASGKALIFEGRARFHPCRNGVTARHAVLTWVKLSYTNSENNDTREGTKSTAGNSRFLSVEAIVVILMNVSSMSDVVIRKISVLRKQF